MFIRSIIAAIMFISATATAADLGVNTSVADGHGGFGVSLSEKLGVEGYTKTGGELKFDRFSGRDYSQLSALVSYDVARFFGVTLTPKVGVVRVIPGTHPSSTSWLAEIEASYPVARYTTLTANLSRTFHNSTTNEYNANIITLGAKFFF